jgi:hypothetical protein
MPGTPWRSCKCSRTHDNWQLSVGTYPIITCHRCFTKGTRIITTITLTPDKRVLVKASFSMRDSVQQGPGQSTPRHVSCPRASHPPKRHSHTTPPTVVWWDATAPVKGLCSHACQPQSIGWCRRQASPSTSTPMWKGLASKQSKVKHM